MNCEREPEVLEAVLAGRWPDGADPELRDHADGCDACDELALVAGAIHADHYDAVHGANVPPAAVVWWRAQQRARAEAVKSAKQTITAVQTGAIASAIVVGLALAGGLGALIAHIGDGVHFGAFDFAPSPSVALLAAVATSLLLAPAAVWLLLARD